MTVGRVSDEKTQLDLEEQELRQDADHLFEVWQRHQAEREARLVVSRSELQKIRVQALQRALDSVDSQRNSYFALKIWKQMGIELGE